MRIQIFRISRGKRKKEEKTSESLHGRDYISYILDTGDVLSWVYLTY